MNEYFDIIHNPKTGRIAINLGPHLKSVMFENGDRVQIIQDIGAVMIDKKVLLDLADYIRSQEG